MAARTAKNKITDALSQLFQGFLELQEDLEEKLGGIELEDKTEEEDVDLEDKPTSPDDALVAEMRSSLESAMESEDFTPADIAGLIAAMTEALEEIDPEVFAMGETEDEEEELDEDDLEDIDDDLDDDFDDEEFEDEDLGEEEVEEEEVEEKVANKKKRR